MQGKSNTIPEKSAGMDRGMATMLIFLGGVSGLLTLLGIIITSFCMYRRQNVGKNMNNGT